ncbi:MAG: GNAT family N-acetyltransferase, partial [Abditibacteriaceae bacterium]
LHGKSVTERAQALVEIAHPDFRAELLGAAKRKYYVFGNLNRFPSGKDPYPKQYEHSKTFLKEDGEEVPIYFRPIRATDERRLQEFFYSHTESTIYLRYGMMVRSMSHERALELVQLDYQKKLALVGLDGSPGNERIVAIGRYILNEQTNCVEVAFVVHEDYRGLGIASHLLERLAAIAREKNFAGVEAQVSTSNSKMLGVFETVLGIVETRVESGETMLVYRFDKTDNTT